MVTDNGCQNRLNRKNIILSKTLEVLQASKHAQANIKMILKWMINGNKIHKIIKHRFGIYVDI